MADEQQRLMEIFSEARAKASAEERDAYLKTACGKDAALRRQVEALLQAHTQLGDFLEPPSDDPPDEYLNTVIDRYKLREQIGEGGFGVVYMAEQTEPVRRKVALKIIKAGMDTREVVARFEAERQALAMMDHPNIAKVYDAGATESGRPYFVMELVNGVPITDYCDRHHLPMPARLELFMQACQAVQHAHQKGIIHRDLKPSNVLVTLIDGKPVPKIIDFGVAKALGQQLTEKTLFTAFQQIVGTPLYMSPEQAAISGVDVDTRSDIYSLGVLLYELLTGFTPIDAETVRKAGLDEVRRLIREADPPRPSTRLQALVTADVRRLKSTEKPPASLDLEPAGGASSPRLLQIKDTIRKVRGDLDWIVMKALEKDRARRYETANGLRADIQRYLEHEPVLAGPPGMAYRAKKYVRRHRVGVALATSVSMALIAGLVVALFGFKQAQRERDRAIAAETQAKQERDHALAAEARAEKNRQQAEVAREKAQTEATRSTQVAQFMKDMLEGVGPSVAMGRDTTLLHEILDQTAERIGKELTNQPEMQAELLETLGQVYREIGEYDNAEAMFESALDLQKKLHGQQHPEVAALLAKLGSVPRAKGELKEPEANLRAALAIQLRLLGEENIQTASTLNRLGTHLRAEGKLIEAEALLRQALAIRRKLLTADHPDTATSLVSLAILLRAQGKFPEAERNLREALAIQKKHFAADLPVVAHTTMELGKTLAAQGKYAEAETNYFRTLTIQRKILGDHPITVRTAGVYVDLLVQQGRLAEAEGTLRELLRLQKKTPGLHDNKALEGLLAKLATIRPELREEVTLEELFPSTGPPPSDEDANALHRIEQRLKRDGKRGAMAITAGRLEVQLQKELHGEESTEVARAMVSLARILSDQGRPDEAEPLAKKAVEIQKRCHGQYDPTVSHALLNVGVILRSQGRSRFAEAEEAYREVLAVEVELKRMGRPQSDFAILSGRDLGELLEQQGRYPDAEAVYREVLVIHQKRDDRFANLLVSLATVLEKQGKLAEAEAALREAIAILGRSVEQNPSQSTLRISLGHTLWKLCEELETLGRLTEAIDVYEEALQVFEKASKDFPTQPYLRQEEAYTSWMLATVLNRSGQLDEAAEEFKRALSLHLEAMTDFPDRSVFRERLVAVRLDLAHLLKTQNKGKEASNCIQETSDLISSWPADATKAACLSRLSFALAEQGKLAEARTNLLEALKTSPTNSTTLYGCALVQLSTGDTNSYRSITRRIAAQLHTAAPNRNTHLVRWTCALAPDAAPDYSPVLQATRQALAGETNTINSYTEQQTLGALLYRAHQYAEAVQELTRTFELGERLDAETLLTSPAYGAYFLTMAHARLGHTAKARESFQRASALDPLTTPVNTNAVSRMSWNRRLTLELLRKEAESLLKPEKPNVAH